jgi:hypothetical protein
MNSTNLWPTIANGLVTIFRLLAYAMAVIVLAWIVMEVF